MDTSTGPPRRHCRSCGAWLARDNTADLCSPCRSGEPLELPGPPPVEPAFWTETVIRRALASRHMGQVIRAYRLHPHHGHQPISQLEVADWVGITQGQVSRIESGPPITDLTRLTEWALLLGIPEAALWFKLPEPPPASPPAALPSAVDTPPHSDPLGILPAEPIAALLDGTSATPVPERVGPLEIDQVRNAASFFEGWDFAYGGGIVREAVMGQLRWSVGLLDVACDRPYRASLFSAVGYLAHTCAFMAYDDLASEDAHRMWRLALACAEDATDWPLRATILAAMARQAMWLGQFDDGLTMAELALVRSDRLTIAEQAMLYGTQARLLAAMGRVGPAMVVLEAADARFARRQADETPPWMAYYDEAEHAGDTGHAFADLALADPTRGTEARGRLQTAVAGHPPEFARSQALCQTRLATLTMTSGDPSEAAELGQQAVDIARPIRSRRLGEYLRELAGATQPYGQLPEVIDLRERIDSAGRV